MSATPGIQSFLAAVSGPATLCRQLRGRTRPIRSMPCSMRAIRSVENRFADELFGEQLLSILSDRLQALLDRKDAILVSSPELNPAPFPNGSREKKTSQALSNASSKNAPAETQSKPGVCYPSDKYIDRQSATNRSLTWWEQAVSNTKCNLIEFDTPSRIPGEAGASLEAPGIPTRAKSTAVPLIVKLIQQYWSQEVRKQNHAALMETQPTQVQSSSTIEPSTKTDSERTRTLPPDQISDRMRTFVSSPFLRPPPPRGATALESNPPSNSVPNRNEPDFAAQPRWASSRNDLEEKLVDILREQAIQHGIDIS